MLGVATNLTEYTLLSMLRSPIISPTTPATGVGNAAHQFL